MRVSCVTVIARAYPGEQLLLRAAYRHLLTPARFRLMQTHPVPAAALYDIARNTLIAEYLRHHTAYNPDILLSSAALATLPPRERTAHLLAQAYADSFLAPMGPQHIDALARRVFTPALRRDPARYGKLSDRFIERIHPREPRTARLALAMAIDLECSARGVNTFHARDGIFEIELYAPFAADLARAALNG
ncbi:hypothetical protein AWR36_006145 [Microbulbifer flavimaris]|uniref:Uncharacterized protein n=2 Tax=Microbulbiferaceae TaxID=1706373 RepID=A0ABX4HZL7_9GAMM|nr:hypothetical protein AWR36_006145 [Microbulbifer flavimaris]